MNRAHGVTYSMPFILLQAMDGIGISDKRADRGIIQIRNSNITGSAYFGLLHFNMNIYTKSGVNHFISITALIKNTVALQFDLIFRMV